ncbi:SusC/RagA family TonB-linked outer membrane protein [Flavihumibacter profundi]|uniref:SusC/RagA family TonB-linked outer membrane protein n=1 Tax=Flavihumibacter profundi TaxID=2716883 RepID=UPI001CC62A2A|nr:TonB-dependent receptor [Flavihumibacter profundi]MBZ5858947.1 TonB-dependent receptor [Flavihumibacter profundi]
MNNSFTLHQIFGKKRLSLMLIALIGLTAAAPAFSYANPADHAGAPFFADRQVSGRIVDEKGIPIGNVSVVVKGTSIGTTTNDDGIFKLNVPEGKNSLMISFVGYKTQEYKLNSSNSVSIVLAQESGTLSDVVVVGYGTQKKVTVTGAVSAVKGEVLVKSPAVDMSNSLAGRLPGLVVIQQGGEPGYDGATISIRGTNTLGKSDPLIVIDGIPDRDGGLGRLNPRDVENISVLKDASAAIYGARAANGAILITTKKGSTGKPKVTYDFNQGWSQPGRVPKMASSPEYASIMNEIPIYQTIPVNEWAAASEAIKSTGKYVSPTPGVSAISANYSPDAVKKFADGSDPWGYPNTDWFGDAFKTWAPQSRHNLALSGGNENVRYFTSLGYVNQDAIYNNSATFYKQYQMRTNLTAKVNKYISANFGLMVRREDRNYPTESAGSIFRMLMRGRPTEPEVWPNGKPGPDIENGQNPYVITTNATGYTKNPKDYMQANGSFEITNPWIKGLKLTLSGAVDKNSQTNKVWQTPWELYYWDKVTYEADGVTPLLVGAVRSNFKDPRLTQSYGQVLNTNLTAMLNYDFKIGTAHSFGLLAGATQEKFTGEGFLAFRRNYISTAVDQLFAGGSLQQNTDGNAYETARTGYYGRAQYNYKEKYLAEFVWRYDGSSYFPEDHRWGFFPGLLLGWNMTNEDWFKVKGINYLKLRASYGQMGNDQVYFNGTLHQYDYLSTYSFGSYPINNEVVTTLGETVVANPSFTWERANNYNIGLDGSFFNNKIDLTLEYFMNKRDQILIQKNGSTPASTGMTTLLPPVNAGKVDNSGYEFMVAYNANIGRDWHIKAGINGGYAKNKVVFMDEIPGAPEYQKQEGKPIDAVLVYQSDGAFLNQDDINKNTLDYSGVTSQLKPGDMKFKDVNGDGKINADDKVRMDKNGTPTLNYGMTLDVRYKGFDLSILFQGASGAVMRIQTESGDIGNYLQYFYDHRWSIDKPSSTDPRLASRGDTYYTGGNFGNNTYYLFSKNYLRLKNIELGYNLPANLLSKANISNLRLFANGLNVFTIDKMKVFDPEATAESGVYYPQSRTVNLGLSLTF